MLVVPESQDLLRVLAEKISGDVCGEMHPFSHGPKAIATLIEHSERVACAEDHFALAVGVEAHHLGTAHVGADIALPEQLVLAGKRAERRRGDGDARGASARRAPALRERHVARCAVHVELRSRADLRVAVDADPRADVYLDVAGERL